MKTIILSSFVVLGLSTAAFAQAAAPDFASVDADANGGVSLTELQTAAPGVTAEQFATLDADGSGELSAEEFAAISAAAPAAPEAVPAPAQ